MKCSKSAIPWCDYGASPVTGCRHECSWCYARGLVKRFSAAYHATDVPGLHVLDRPFFGGDREHGIIRDDGSEYWIARNEPYPFGFAPTFHRYRLDMPAPRKPGRVFVCPMADLWGAWVPQEWQDEVLVACAREPRHDYLFLTKNPAAYLRVDWRDKPWAWLGATATNAKQASNGAWYTTELGEGVSFLSLEPWLGGDSGLTGVAYGPNGSIVDWLILGPLTGPKARAAPPVSRDAVLRLRDACDRAGVALFVKPSATAWGLTPEEIATMRAFPRPHPSKR